MAAENENENEIKIPDIGGASDVDVIEIFVKPGDTIQENDSLVTLESDKASMEIPAPRAGVVSKVLIKVGDKVSEGSIILILKADGVAKQEPSQPQQKQETESKPKPESQPEPETLVSGSQISEKEKTPETSIEKTAPVSSDLSSTDALISAGPAVRRLARELGVDLAQVAGSGRKLRVTKEDIQNYVKTRLAEGSGSTGLAILPMPTIDFTKFGTIEVKPLNKIKRLTGQQVHRSWVSIPHVTQFDEADITDLESFRKLEAQSAEKGGYKLTILAFVVKAVCRAFATFPQFNASLDSSLENLIYKQYYNIGIAVETPNGLVVPVIKEVNSLSVADIAIEMARLSQKAREKGLSPADMSGGNFTISSLGGIGGTAFTPIVNSPDVAILGLSRAVMKPVYDGCTFQARLMLPLSLSYDHRVIDGAEAARFTQYIVALLSDIRRIIL